MNKRMAGVALITSLLLLSVITLLVLAMTTRQQLDLQRSAHLSHAEQSYWYALSAVNWARRVLNSDDRGVDSEHDNWGGKVSTLAIEQGTMAVSIIDLQGRFNLNNLLQADEPHPVSVARFKRLLTQLDINSPITPALLDWLDEDTTETPGGAEDRYYATLKPPYRAANRLMADPSELRLVRGVNEEIYAKIRPHITTLPVVTGININTASPPVLASLAANNELDVNSVIAGREKNAFSNIKLFKTYLPMTTDESATDGLVVASSYFLLTTDVTLGVAHQRRHTRLVRDEQTTTSLNQSPAYQ